MTIALLTAVLLVSSPDPSETARIRAHLLRAEQAARAASIEHLTPAQRQKRRSALAVLAGYRERGLFPLNRDFDRPTPYFVDAAGTRCAMAELIHATGDDALVEAVARTNNNAFVRELAAHPDLVAWLDENGISVDEAAMIQPSYCGFRSAGLCRRAGATGIAEVTYAGDEGTSVLYRVDRVLFGELPDREVYSMPSQGSMPAPDRAVLTHDRGADRYGLFALYEGTRVRLQSDPDCDGYPSLTIDQLVAVLGAGEECQDEAELIDPGWATTACFDGSEPDRCAPDDALPQLPSSEPEIEERLTTADSGGCTAVRGGLPSWLLVLALLIIARARRHGSE